METLTEPAPALNLNSLKERQTKFRDTTTLLGYVLLFISAGLYGLEELNDISRGNDNFTIFFIHYFLALAFVIVLLINKSYGIRRSWRREHIHKTIILLNLFLISAYALNRELPVFEDSVTWFCTYLLITSGAILSHHYLERLPKFVRYVQQFLLGSALVLYIYMIVYVANFYILGTIGILLFGIGAHIFVPSFLFAATIRVLVFTHEKRQLSIYSIVSGIVTTILLSAAFVGVWNARVNTIDRIANQSVIHADTHLPVWVKVAQTVKNDWITERILKSTLVYTVSNEHFQWDFFSLNSNWDEKRKHDPLVFLASGYRNSALSHEDRKDILKATSDNRHKAQERLWSGDNLTTSYIVTDVDIYPELRISYSEHYLNIHNDDVANRGWWGNSQEAIYTFQLPEGAVVTSLSLWVNGKEEKAILTSKQKAAEAYNTIVGREMRDPSVVHWQEGNTISVRVFPCTPQEERKFKIGITSPLSIDGKKAVYKNVTFRGPHAGSATQTSRIRFIGKAQNLNIPDRFTKNVKGEYVSEGNYDADLLITMDLTPIIANRFSFNGFVYSLSDMNVSRSNVSFTDVYLDINNSWTSDEITSLYSILDRYNVYVYYDSDFVLLSPDNWESLTSTLQEANFSLFPFHHIKDPGKTLVVTKGKELSPFLQDIKTSTFAEGVKEYFASGQKVYVFNLEGGTSTYIKSLKEFRAFNFAQGRVNVLLDILDQKSFPATTESDEQIVLHESGLMISKRTISGENGSDNAPDHLARLFAYNNIMRQVGVNFFTDDFVNDALVDEAATAYVVSPVSSLVVLETKEDYERFGIKDKDNSLHNATKDSSGAVPEPHEWALIILFLMFIIVYFVRYSHIKLPIVQK